MRRPLYGWLTADAISYTGTRISQVAIPLFVLHLTGSATQTGLAAFCETLPLVLLKVLGGPIVDRVGGRPIAVACDAASVLAVGAVPLLVDSGALPFGLFLVLVAVAGALRGPGDGAKQAMVPAIVRAAGVPMERATGLAGTVERTASLLGAALAGVLVASVGAANALYVDAASFGVAALVFWWATAGLPSVVAAAELEPDSRPDAGAAGTAYGRRLRAGWDFLRHDPVLLGIAVMVALTNVLDAGWVSVLVPVWALRSGSGAAGVGTLFAVFGGASALGALTASVYAARLPRYRIYLVCFLVTGLPRFVLMATPSPLWLVLAFAVVAGYASGFLNPVLGAVIYERIPEPLVGRVSSLTTSMAWSLMPLGGLGAGLLVSGVGLPAAMLGVGVAYFAVTMLPAVQPRWREMDRRPNVPATPARAPSPV